MRDLASTGFLSNRMRQMVASWLIHDVPGDWRAGAAWFVQQRGFTAADVWEVVQPPPPEACSEDDPTSDGCLTPTTRRLHDAAVARFDADLRGVSCWSEHAWNPSSDHPSGRACDFFPTRSGRFPVGQCLATVVNEEWHHRNFAERDLDVLIAAASGAR